MIKPIIQLLAVYIYVQGSDDIDNNHDDDDGYHGDHDDDNDVCPDDYDHDAGTLDLDVMS